MFDAQVFVPGKRRLTNGMLTDLRAAGVYAGRAAERGRKPRVGFDKFAAETRAIRFAVGNAWLKWMETKEHYEDSEGLRGGGLRLDVRFFVTGHRRHDPDAWYLLAKPALDGFAAAFGISDRFRMGEVAGMVAQKAGDDYFPWMYEGDCFDGWTDLGDEIGFHMRVWAP